MKVTALEAEQHEGGQSYILIGEPGEEAMSVLSEFARTRHLDAAQLTGVGAFARATVGWFDREAKDYRRIQIDQQCELLSLLGDIAESDEGPQVHVHVVLGLPDGTTRGGHLLGAEIWPTLEVVVREAPAHLRKKSRPEFGLALIDPDLTS
jgi:hypothetical protein